MIEWMVDNPGKLLVGGILLIVLIFGVVAITAPKVDHTNQHECGTVTYLMPVGKGLVPITYTKWCDNTEEGK